MHWPLSAVIHVADCDYRLYLSCLPALWMTERIHGGKEIGGDCGVRLKVDAQPKLKCLGGGRDDRWNNRIGFRSPTRSQGYEKRRTVGRWRGRFCPGSRI